ncbi:hypothetical protein [Candidatus Mesenet endosymbiont of Agriotes lineatus]|uniref:hypothetical protein n=1 Tax=Candidatus Mesenet endosymbiont of Agriotes lineatus TaxID=3077948 RepID=UPI0030D2DB10
MFSKLEDNNDFSNWLKINGYEDSFLSSIKLDDLDFRCLKKSFNTNKDLLDLMVKNGYKPVNEYILGNFFGIKIQDCRYIFVEGKGNVYFKLYKDFIIMLLKEEFSNDYLLQILNQFVQCHFYVINKINNEMEDEYNGRYCLDKNINSNKMLVEYKGTLLLFCKYSLSYLRFIFSEILHERYCKLDRYENNLLLFHLSLQNGLPYELIDNLFSIKSFEEIKTKNNKELFALLIEKNIVTFSQNENNFIIQDSPILNLLVVNTIKVSDLLSFYNNRFRLTKKDIEKKINEVKGVVKRRIEEVQTQSNLPDRCPSKAPRLAKEVIRKLGRNQNEVPSLMTLSVGAILNSQEKKILEEPQIEEVKALLKRNGKMMVQHIDKYFSSKR